MSDRTPVCFEESPLRDLYIFELHRLAYRVRVEADRLFELTAGDPYQAIADFKIDAPIYAVVTDAARIQKLLVAGNQYKNETDDRYEFRKARAAFLLGLLGELKLVELHNTTLRNALEHFDERLDDATLEIARLGASLEAFATTSLCVWGLERLPETPSPLLPLYRMHGIQGGKPVLPIRIYTASDHRYYILGESIDLQKLRAECSEIEVRMLDLRGQADIEETPTLLIYVAKPGTAVS